MPKSAKKRKDKAADFAKAKLKLGKEKKAPSNVIDTSFKARSIALPTQSITVSRDESAPTTKKKLTIDDLLAHLKHYSPSVKKDALLGLAELLEAHWILVDKSLSQLINQLSRIIGDEDAGVRKQLHGFLSWILPRIPQEDLIPHASTLILFTASAQTHIFPEIRIDAVRFLALFLEFIPEPFVEGWDKTGSSHGKRILEGYLGNLNAGMKHGGAEGPAMATSTSSVILSPSSKLAVLQSFSSFLRAGLAIKRPNHASGGIGGPLNAWFMSKSFASEDAFWKFESTLTPIPPSSTKNNHLVRTFNWDQPEGWDRDHPLINSDISWSLREVEDVLPSSDSTLERFKIEDSTSSFLSVLLIGVQRLCRTLHPLLVSTILDCAPSVFAPDAKASETEASMILTVSQIASLLYGTILGGGEAAPASSLSELEALLGYMTPYFPFASSKSRDMKVWCSNYDDLYETRKLNISSFAQDFQGLNLIYCELTSLLVLRLNTISTKPRRSLKPSNPLITQVSIVSDYITKLLRSQTTRTSQVPHSLLPGSYLALLPSIWAIINNLYTEVSSHTTEVLQALLDHANQTVSKSSTKRLTIEFVARLILLGTDPQFRGTFRIGSNDQAQQRFEKWLIHLPQVLWEIGDSDPMTTEVILRFLLRLLQRRSSLVDPETISALTLRLVPYFTVSHPLRGQLPGPYSKISPAQSHLRRLCLDTVATLLVCGDHIGADVSEACIGLLKALKTAVAGTVEEEYWTHVYKGVSSC
ncbi:hypothetical protein AN958_04959 [Leucoagaricus sp. SymC.cos]|nr:hypothetical protein AN958_04959 [Leucoagaricus sp. SymC.cos]